jgi:hypothetical protein
LLALLSKAGTIYLIDRTNLGKDCANLSPACSGADTNIVQEITGAFTGYWGAPAYWNGYLYWAGGNGDTGAAEPLKAYSFNANGSGLLSTTPTSVSAKAFNFSSPVPSVSSNGTSDGILWGLDNSAYGSTCSGGTNCQVLYAYDATNLANLLYTSSQAANNRDVPGTAVKFTTPTVANGKVYVASSGSVSAFGLLSAVAPTAAAPTLSPVAGTYASAQTVTLADTTPGASIYYTTNGTTPTTASSVYTAPLTISATTTVSAIAVASGYTTSPVSSAVYTISTPTAATPTVSPAAGSYTSAQTVTLADTTAGAVIYYTTNGTTPSTASSKYTAPFSVTATTTVKALATATGYTNSAVVSATFTIAPPPSTAAAPTFSPAAGTYTSAQTVSLADATAGAVIYYTTNGTTPTTASTKYSAPFSVGTTTTVNAIAAATGYTNSAVSSAIYTITSSGGATPVPVSLAAAASVYAIGAPGAKVANGGIDTWGDALSSSNLGASVTWSGVTFTLGTAGTASAAHNTTIALPAVSAAALSLLATAVNGNHGGQTFVVTYTDGSTSTFTQGVSDWLSPASYANETVALVMPNYLNQYGVVVARQTKLFGFSFALNAAKTVKSLTLPANTNVIVFAATLTPSGAAPPPPTAATPSLSLAAGTYTAAQSVTLADTTPGAVIYYTTNGSTPTTASAVYSGPLTIATTTTVSAIAVAAGYTNSSVASAVYTITLATPAAATPTLSLAAGTYSAAQSVTIADSTPGAVIYYTTNGTTPSTASAVYSGALTVSATETLEAIAVATGYSNSAVASATYNFSTVSTGTTPVSLTASATVYAIGTDGSPVTHGGIDTWGFAFSSVLLGPTVTWAGATFPLGAPNTASGASNTTLALPAVNSTTLNLLAVAVNGSQLNQAFVVTYTDGTTATYDQNVSDWYASQSYGGESIAVSMAYRLNQYGVIDTHVVDLYGYSFALDSTKTVKTLTLPANASVIVMGVAL